MLRCPFGAIFWGGAGPQALPGAVLRCPFGAKTGDDRLSDWRCPELRCAALSGLNSWVTERSVLQTKPDTVMQSVTSPFFGPKGQRSKALGNAQGKRSQTHTALKGRRSPSCWSCVLPQAVPPFQG